ncbi:hypothetical protein QMK47_19355 [Pseudomonas sp. P9_35]|uniref:hypothetical protein n=1 Tax=unclassified Pseudomonas TaxID=196821 RepID=UPI002A363017|nr:MULTISPECIES: hypothetical protein [unclassified Pseudomonas]WPN61696.1 hypothetical protein QMK48_18450 [Pseudomonas sp. P9_32]WPN67452.1 hypothetical protein QMK47_19355 [Pseudomonas sp. P9_35]
MTLDGLPERGSWKGLRAENGKYQFLSWKNDFKPDGRFTITFFRDAQQTQPIQTEHGIWSAANGKNELRTDGVRMPDVYTYKLIDVDTVHYVSLDALDALGRALDRIWIGEGRGHLLSF